MDSTTAARSMPAELRLADDRVAAFFESVPDAVIVADGSGRIVLANTQAGLLFGYGRERMLGAKVETLLPDRFRRGHAAHRAEFAADPRTRPMGASLDLFGLRHDGTEFPVDISLSSLDTDDGRFFVAAIRDGSERKKLEQAQRDLAAIVENSDDAIIGKTIDGVVTSWNRGAQRLYGYTAEEMVGRSIGVLSLPGREDEVLALLDRVRTGELVEHFETERVHKDGRVVAVSIAVSPIRDAAGAVTGASIVARDISKQQQERQRFLSFMEFAPDAIVIIDASGAVVQVNAQTEELFGYERSELVGEPVETLLPERFHHAHVAHRSAYAAQPRARSMGASSDLYGLRKDGVEFAVDVKISPLEWGDEGLFAAAVRDVTERRRLESLRDSFIANAAHELRTPLTALTGIGETLATFYDQLSAEEITDALAALARQGDRAIRLVNNLLDLTQLDGDRAELDLQRVEVAGAAARALESAPPPDGRTVRVESNGVAVVADANRLNQILTNLLSNAYRYGGPNVSIWARRMGAQAEVVVEDDGDGVEEQVVTQMFEPFVRGRKSNAVGGSGIGLAVCRSLAEAFGGSIEYEAAIPHGARMIMKLPAS